MTDDKSLLYVQKLAAMIRRETVSRPAETDRAKFAEFRDMLPGLFPHIFEACELAVFSDGFALRWKGSDPSKKAVLFMNHFDVVEAPGDWTHAPFSGDMADGKLWGRGALDDKGGLWAMLQAADELAEEGFAPSRDIWFSSSSTEETDGAGAAEIAEWFKERGVRFEMSFDEGGMILHEPIRGANGTLYSRAIARQLPDSSARKTAAANIF